MPTKTTYRYEIRYANGQRERFVTSRPWDKVTRPHRESPRIGPWRVVSVRKVVG
jgi:hypothetical protein